MNSVITKHQDRVRSGEWWVADEEPEIYPAQRVRANRIMPKSIMRRVIVIVGLAIAAGLGGALFF